MTERLKALLEGERTELDPEINKYLKSLEIQLSLSQAKVKKLTEALEKIIQYSKMYTDGRGRRDDLEDIAINVLAEDSKGESGK